MSLTLLGSVMLVKPLQYSKAYDGMVVTLFPILTVVRFEHCSNIVLSDHEPESVHAVAFQLTIVRLLQP